MLRFATLATIRAGWAGAAGERVLGRGRQRSDKIVLRWEKDMKSVGCFVAALVLFIAASGVGPAHSQTPSAKAANGVDTNDKFADLRGEWRRAGAGFACAVKAPEKLEPNSALPEILARACSFLGPLALGDDAQAVTKALGAPHRSLPQPNGATASIYFLEQVGQYPYFVATVSKNRIVVLQVTGPVAAKGFSFNHVDLGATTDTLVQYFGQPNHLGPSGEKDTDLWTYNPWPFSFEVKGGHVTSIRIASPI
jgi:hypothetical protein